MTRWTLGMVMAFGVLGAGVPVAQAKSLSMFGICLERERAVFYGTSWCPHCRAQEQLLGTAMRYVNYVDCTGDDDRGTSDTCRAAGITSFPTWEFRDGTKVGGRLSLEALAARSGCSLDDSETETD